MVRTETPWGPWEPLPPGDVADIFARAPFQWWLAGGYALEAFVGQAYREHADIDIGLRHGDQRGAREYLSEWDLHCADPPGTLRPWAPGESLAAEIHDIWVRRDSQDAWGFQLMFDHHEGNEWVYRRDPRVRRPLSSITWHRDGVAYLAPEVQLLYKSRAPRLRDTLDFETVWPRLNGEQREWLRSTLLTTDATNPWLEAL